MRGTTTELLLEAARDGLDLGMAFLRAGYGASLREIEYERHRQRERRIERDARAKHERQIKQRFYSMLSLLRHDGLIENRKQETKTTLVLTRKGRKKLLELKNAADMPPPFYRAESKSSKPIIVVFDIPEKERRKRDWLRPALASMNFRPIQKSVWVGSSKIPEAFLRDLRELYLVEYVEILQIDKSGSLRQII